MSTLTWHRSKLEGYQAVQTAIGAHFTFWIFQKPGEWDYEIDIFHRGADPEDYTQRVFATFLATVGDAKKLAAGWDSKYLETMEALTKFNKLVDELDIDLDKKP